MTDKQTLKELGGIYRILEAGEKGYALSAVNVNNRGLKILLKSFAQQRSKFKETILVEMKRIGAEPRARRSLLAAIHRGRINIFAALTVGRDKRERAVLREILISERFALQSFKRALKKDLNPETRRLLTNQREDIEKIVEQITLLHGVEGRRMVVRLFESETDADAAELEIKKAGLHPDVVFRIDMKYIVDQYTANSTIVSETILSAAVGGAFWGGLVGIIAGLGMHAARFAPIATMSGRYIWAYLALAGIFIGEFIGSLLGYAIGEGLSGEDAYQYDWSLKRGKILLLAKVEAMRASEAGRIMSQVNLKSKNRIEGATAY